MRKSTAGFSIVEVLVAIIILSVGLLALAQTSGSVSKMIGRGKQDTQAAMAVQAKLDSLRQVARNTTPKCTSLASGTGTGPATGTTTAWTVTGSGDSRNVRIVVTYRIGKGSRSDTTMTVLGCV